MNITWKTIPGFSNYQVNQLGYVQNIKTNNVFYNQKNVQLSDGSRYKIIPIARLVAESFIQIPIELIDIKSSKLIVALVNKGPASVDNLYWTTRKDIQFLMYKDGRKIAADTGKFNELNKSSITVYQFTKHGEFIRSWPNAQEVNRQLGYSPGNIWACCNGMQMTSKGFIWSYNKYLT